MGKSTGLDPSLAARRELAEIRKALLDPVRGPSSRDGTSQSAKVAARHQPDSMYPLTGLPMAPRSRSVGSNLAEDHAVRARGASRIRGGRRGLPPVCEVPRRLCEESPPELCTVRWGPRDRRFRTLRRVSVPRPVRMGRNAKGSGRGRVDGKINFTFPKSGNPIGDRDIAGRASGGCPGHPWNRRRFPIHRRSVGRSVREPCRVGWPRLSSPIW